MATNNIKIFDQNKVNMLTDEAYNTSTQRLNGVQQGIASSQLQNKTLYQVSLVAYAIGQMMQANGLNANDADAVSTFAGNLSSTIVQKILDKASTVEAKNFTVNNKFVTPQTWKAAYDFMKADSDMVTSAVDDTHYITPKLLKEGAEKYGDKVRLEDGSLASGIDLGGIYVAKEIVTFDCYPVLNNKAFLLYRGLRKIDYVYLDKNNKIGDTIASFELSSDYSFKYTATGIAFAEEGQVYLCARSTSTSANFYFFVYKLENNIFTEKIKHEISLGSNTNSLMKIRPSYINVKNNIIDFLIYLDYNFYIFEYNKLTNNIEYKINGSIQHADSCYLDEQERTIVFYAPTGTSASTTRYCYYFYVYNKEITNERAFTINTGSRTNQNIVVSFYKEGYAYASVSDGNVYFEKIKLSDSTFTRIENGLYTQYEYIGYLNNKIIFAGQSILDLSTDTFSEMPVFKIGILPVRISDAGSYGVSYICLGKSESTYYEVSDGLLVESGIHFAKVKKVKLLGFFSEA